MFWIPLKKFKCLLGFRSYSWMRCSNCRFGKGSVVFEKHITLNKKNRGPDHHYAMNPKEFKVYVEN